MVMLGVHRVSNHLVRQWQQRPLAGAGLTILLLMGAAVASELLAGLGRITAEPAIGLVILGVVLGLAVAAWTLSIVICLVQVWLAREAEGGALSGVATRRGAIGIALAVVPLIPVMGLVSLTVQLNTEISEWYFLGGPVAPSETTWHGVVILGAILASWPFLNVARGIVRSARGGR